MNICLYGASSTELDARYLDAAYDLGRRIAAGGHTMVYGGGAQGVMARQRAAWSTAAGPLSGSRRRFSNVHPAYSLTGAASSSTPRRWPNARPS